MRRRRRSAPRRALRQGRRHRPLRPRARSPARRGGARHDARRAPADAAAPRRPAAAAGGPRLGAAGARPAARPAGGRGRRHRLRAGSRPPRLAHPDGRRARPTLLPVRPASDRRRAATCPSRPRPSASSRWPPPTRRARSLPEAARGLPRPNNPHLGYAITWYGLAVSLVGVFVAFARQRITTETTAHERRLCPPQVPLRPHGRGGRSRRGAALGRERHDAARRRRRARRATGDPGRPGARDADRARGRRGPRRGRGGRRRGTTPTSR